MIPIIYYHAGAIRNATSAPRHLEVSIHQSKNFNNRVILLGDESNSHLDVEHYRIADYFDGVDKFRSSYAHMSSNEPAFEMACIERWIVLANFVEKMNLEKVVYLDSDIMTFCNYEERESIFDEDYVGMACSPKRFGPDVDSPKDWGVTGCISYWRHNIILKFKDFILSSYSDNMDKLLHKWNWHIDTKHPGGICDMTLMYLFYFENNLQSLCKVQKDNSVFDQNYYVPETYMTDEYAMSGRGKTITWKEEDLVDLNGNPHHTPYYHNLLFNENEETLIRVNALPELARFF